MSPSPRADCRQGIRRTGGLSQCNGEETDHQDDEELDPAANRTKHRPAPLCLPRPALCIILNSGCCQRCDSELHRTRRPGHRVLCVAEPLERFAGAGSRAQRVDSRKREFRSGPSQDRLPGCPRFYHACHHGQEAALCRPWRLIVATGRFSGFANERLDRTRGPFHSIRGGKDGPPPPEGPVPPPPGGRCGGLPQSSRLIFSEVQPPCATRRGRHVRPRNATAARLIEPNLAEHNGKLITYTGDGFFSRVRQPRRSRPLRHRHPTKHGGTQRISCREISGSYIG